MTLAITHLIRRIISMAVLFACTGCPPALAETYSWTDAAGTLHFSDDRSAVPRSAQTVPTDPSDKPADISPEIVGLWSNRKDSYATMALKFHGDRSGEMMTASGFQVRFSWLVRGDGRISLELQEAAELTRSGRRHRTHTVLADYDRERDLLVLRDEERQEKMGTFYPDDAERDRQKPGRPHPPGRLKFAETTVADKLTGLTWTRNLDLPGSLRRHRNAGQFLMELNDKGFGDRVDWRLPTIGEMQELIATLKEFGQESGRSSATGSVLELMAWIGFTNPKGRCYWTDTDGEHKGERYAYFPEDEEQRSFGHQQTCGIWPVRGNR